MVNVTRAAVEIRGDARRELRAALDHGSRLGPLDLTGTQLGGRRLELGQREIEVVAHRAATRSRWADPRMPFTNPAASAAHSSFAASTASSIATSSGTSERWSSS